MARLLRILALVTALAFCSTAASAQTNLGIRAGVSGDPDQFVFGAHLDTPPILPHVTFRPNVEVGVGDNLTLVAVNVEFAYWIPLHGGGRLYAGGGPAANIYDHRHRSGSNVEGGVNLLVGAEHDRGPFAEFKVGLADSPSFKFTIGYSFK